ncbi:hypothetical protein AB0D78_43410 [Streptomyces avermitilis]
MTFGTLDIGASPSFPEDLIVKRADWLHDEQLGCRFSSVGSLSSGCV